MRMAKRSVSEISFILDFDGKLYVDALFQSDSFPIMTIILFVSAVNSAGVFGDNSGPVAPGNERLPLVMSTWPVAVQNHVRWTKHL